ncbi:peptidase [Bacillus gobiensis]|uniref:peptidase n=1 Tax=Bacillus gobiensis TaxID=1441095 RepID=UPI003D25185C
MINLEEKVCRWIEDNKDNAVRLLKKLIAEKSTIGEEFNAQAVILEKLRQFQMEVDVYEPSIIQLKQHPYFVSGRENFAESPNIVARKHGSGGGKSIILNGHIDVVPEGSIGKWSTHPYLAVEKNGKVYGRGASDMKGGTTALLLAIEALEACGVTLKGDLIFQSVTDEENGGAGTLSTVLRGYKADGALIPEPTNLKLFIKQQGSMWFRIIVKGLSAHGGTRYEGVSAIEKSVLVLNALKELEKKRNVRIKDPLYHNTPIPVPINIGTIHGGSWPSSVADLVQIEGRCGVAPDEDMDHVKLEFENGLKSLEKQDEWFKFHPVELEWYGAHWLPNALDENHDLVRSLEASFEKITNHTAKKEASPWGTDGGMLFHAGNIPTIVFGPGETKVAHHTDEYIEIEAMLASAKIISLFLLDWCEIEND